MAGALLHFLLSPELWMAVVGGTEPRGTPIETLLPNLNHYAN